MITQDDVMEVQVHSFVAFAPDLQIAPGVLAQKLNTTLGNGRPFLLVRINQDGSFHYHQQLGCLTLQVFND